MKVQGQRSKSRSKGQSSRSQRNVTYQQQIRSKTATDRLSDFKLATGDVLKGIGSAWNSAANNKLHAIYPIAGTSCQNNLTSRREAVIINRLKIGHFRLTHSIYYLEKANQYAHPVMLC